MSEQLRMFVKWVERQLLSFLDVLCSYDNAAISVETRCILSDAVASRIGQDLCRNNAVSMLR